MRYWYKWILVLSSSLLVSSTTFAQPTIEGLLEYERNIHISPEHKQILADDVSRYQTAENIWEVLRQEFSLEHYENDPQVQAQIEWFMLHQDFLLRSAARAAPYLYFIHQQILKRHLPSELVLLPIIESSYNPYAISPAGASGIWQMMPETASGYGIHRDIWYDGRRDVVASTKAALSYLNYLGNFFGRNWLLAMAAYDTGIGNVSYAINRNIREGYNTDFWSLRLAQETRIYVPRLLALATIVANPDRYPIYLPPIRNAPYLAQLDVGTQIDLHHAALFAGISFKQLMQLNSGFNRTATDPTAKHKLIIPVENVAQFSEKLSQSPLYQRYNTPMTTLADLEERYAPVSSIDNSADQFNKDVRNTRASVTETEDRDYFNKYTDSNGLTQPVSPAVTYRPQPTTTARKILTSVKGNYMIQPGDTIYMARLGDDVDRIARRFHIERTALLSANPIDPSRPLRTDQRLVIPTHLTNTQIARIMQPKPLPRLATSTTIYKVKLGDTVEKIARRFHTSAPEIRLANLIEDTGLHTGDRLVIPVHT